MLLWKKIVLVKEAMWHLPRWFRWLLVAGLLTVVCYSAWKSYGASEADKAKMGAVKADSRVVCEGIVVPLRYSSMSLQVSGVVAELYVSEGQQVQPGQILVRLASDELQAKAAGAKAGYSREAAGLRVQEIAMKKAVMKQAEEVMEQAQVDFERMQSLYEKNAVSRQDYDKSRTAWLKAKADWEHAKADHEMAVMGSRAETVAAAQAEAQAAEALASQAVLRAPFAGTVAYLDHKVGEHVPAGTPLVRLGVLTDWRVQTDDLTELQIAKVREGAKVMLTFDGLPGLELPGKVVSIRAFGEKKRGDITYTVFIEPERYEPRLKWSMTAIVKIEPAL